MVLPDQRSPAALGPLPVNDCNGAGKTAQWHVITPEYPPQFGGVSDYTGQLSAGLAHLGDEVHVWCPGARGEQPQVDGVVLHSQLGGFTPGDLRRAGIELDRFPAPRRILIQWVPHGYGYRSMNVGFCWWVWKRAARHGDRVELMVHEPYLSFRWGALRQNAAALAHRLMTMLLLGAARRVWMSIPGWERFLRPYAFGRNIPFHWLPIPSNVTVQEDSAGAQAVRRRYAEGGRILIGHFGTFGSLITSMLEPVLAALAADSASQVILLMGGRSEQFREELIRKQPRLASLVQATGKLCAQELSYHLAACDMLIQPYPDGVSSRRTSFMAGLSHGRATVTTSGKLTEPLWSESGAAVLAPAGDPDAFLAETRRIREDSAERQRLGRAARKLYQDRFDISHVIGALRRAELETECVLS